MWQESAGFSKPENVFPIIEEDYLDVFKNVCLKNICLMFYSMSYSYSEDTEAIRPEEDVLLLRFIRGSVHSVIFKSCGH